MSPIPIAQHEIGSPTLGNSRAVWIQQPPAALGREPEGLCIFLDGEYYLAHIRAAAIVDELQADGRIPPGRLRLRVAR